MEEKKISIWHLIIVLIILFILFAGYKNLKSHQEKEIRVVNNKILESAKECFLKQECEGEITLKDLYDKKYIDLQINPLTKENMDDNLCIKFVGKDAVFCK